METEDTQRPTRRSRGASVQSYRVEDKYKFLDLDIEDRSSQQTKARDADVEDALIDGDDFVPEAQDDDEEDEEFMEIVDIEEGEHIDSGSEADTRNPRKRGNQDSDAETETPEKRRRVHSTPLMAATISPAPRLSPDSKDDTDAENSTQGPHAPESDNGSHAESSTKKCRRAPASDEESEAESPVKKRRRPKKKAGALSTSAAAGLFKPKVKQANLKKAVPKLPTSKEGGEQTTQGSKPPNKDRVIKRKLPENVQARGVDDWGRGTRGGGLEARMMDLFGPTDQDLKPVLQTKHWWKSLLTMPRDDILRESVFVSDETRLREVQQVRQWYSTRGEECFARGQMSRTFGEEEGAKYMSNAGSDSMPLLMGSMADPHLYRLEKGSSISTGTAFNSDHNRRGWVMNFGARIQASEWAPGGVGSSQYLAVAVQQNHAPKRRQKPLEEPQAPAFSATPAFPASVQIWAFESTEQGKLDSKTPPKLVQVICADWGAPKHLKWCPLTATDGAKPQNGQPLRLGLLAGIWSDGKVRILDVSVPNKSSNTVPTKYIHIAQSAFEVELDAIPTCLHWLSGTSLIIGTAAGILASWDLTHADAFPPLDQTEERQHKPRPWFCEQVANTFILTLSSGYPSRANFVSITIADGDSKLLDLRAPGADITLAARGRMFGITQAWHEHTQAFLQPDENYLLRCNTVRRYYSNIHVMRHTAQIVSCATSPFHPTVLIGGADGQVLASNPVPRVLNSKEVPWQQIWFSHEWRPAVEQLGMKVAKPPSAAGQADIATPEVLSQPSSRMTEGYKTGKVALQPFRSATDPHTKDFIKPVTIFEEPSSITALAWNPNLKFATWAVAGMGDGLLRVEDLGI